MKNSVNFSQFCDAFNDYGREDSYTYEGKRALFDWFEQYEEDCNTEIEIDVIAICCEFTEYGSADEAASNYFAYEGMTYDEEGAEVDTPDEVEDKALEYLNENTMVIEFDGGVIIQDF